MGFSENTANSRLYEPNNGVRNPALNPLARAESRFRNALAFLGNDLHQNTAGNESQVHLTQHIDPSMTGLIGSRLNVIA